MMLTYLAKVEQRRLGTLTLDAGQLVQFFRELGRGRITWAEGIPEDARVVGVEAEPGALTIRIYLESETFPMSAPGGYPYPFDGLHFTTYTPSLEMWGHMMEASKVLPDANP